MICWKKREKFWLPSSEAQINDPKTQTYSVNSHIRQRKAANLRSWSQLKWPLLVQKGKTTLRIPKDIRKLFTPRRVFSGVEIMGPCTEALKFHPNYWETFPGPCVCAYHWVPVWQVIEVRAEAADMAAAAAADGAAKPEEELKAWAWPALCCWRPNWRQIKDCAFIFACKWVTGQCCYCQARVLEQEA